MQRTSRTTAILTSVMLVQKRCETRLRATGQRLMKMGMRVFLRAILLAVTNQLPHGIPRRTFILPIEGTAPSQQFA